MTESAERRVAAGMSWLDMQFPNHLHLGDPGLISVGHKDFSPLGRVTGESLDYRDIIGRLGFMRALDLGFIPIGAPARPDSADERALTEQWRIQYAAMAVRRSSGESGDAMDFLLNRLRDLANAGLMSGPSRPETGGGSGFLTLSLPPLPTEIRVSEAAWQTFNDLFQATLPGAPEGVELDLNLNLMDVGDTLVLCVLHAMYHQLQLGPIHSWVEMQPLVSLVYNAGAIFTRAMDQLGMK